MYRIAMWRKIGLAGYGLSCTTIVQFVGLLTYTFRGFPQRPLPAFSDFSNDPLSRKRSGLRANSTAAWLPCPGFAPGSLSSRVSVLGSRDCHFISRIYVHRRIFPGGGSQVAGATASCKAVAAGQSVCRKRPPAALLKVCARGHTNHVIRCYSVWCSFFLAA